MASSLNEYRAFFDLRGKNALVAGGAGGIGRSVSEGLAALGCRVFLTARGEAKAEVAAREIREAGGDAQGLALDVESMDDLGRFMTSLHEQVEKVDVLVNCVGQHIEAPAVSYKEEDWDHILAVNLKTAFFLSQEIAKRQIGTKAPMTSTIGRSFKNDGTIYGPSCMVRLYLRACEWLKTTKED